MASQCLQAWVASERIASRVFRVSVSEHLVKIGAVPNLQRDKCLKIPAESGRERITTEKELKRKDATTD